MWWIKKKKKCPCTCHFTSTGQINPPDVHCPNCAQAKREADKRKRESTQGQRSLAVRNLDKLFSDYIRIKGNWTCVKCGRQYPPETNDKGDLVQKLMTTSHFFGRGKYGTRWDEDNCDPLCLFCHQKVENNKKDTVEGFNYEVYMIEKLGKQRFALLQYKAESRAGFSLFDISIMKGQMVGTLRKLQEGDTNVRAFTEGPIRKTDTKEDRSSE